MNEERIRQIIREELSKMLTETVKKGDRVRTPHGTGEVLQVLASQVKVDLDSGATIKVHRDRAVCIN
jgi:preprotein translocase subunit YajC